MSKRRLDDLADLLFAVCFMSCVIGLLYALGTVGVRLLDRAVLWIGGGI